MRWLGWLLLCSPLWAQTMADYTAYPLFMALTVKPNILIILDNSGSMNYLAYPGSYDPDTSYYGYFDPEARYTYRNDRFERDPEGEWDGNWLNWLCMRRIDIARKVLVGGKAVSRTGGGATDLVGEAPWQPYRYYQRWYDATDESPYHGHYCYGIRDGYIYVDDDSWPYHGYIARYRIRVHKDQSEEPEEFLDGNVAGVIQRVGDRARFGLMFFNQYGARYEDGSGWDGGYIASYVGGNLTDLIVDIENTGATTWTPLAESFYEAVRYFQQQSPYYSSSDYSVGQAHDPYYSQEEGQYVPCAKSFVILITDGESTKDLNIPAELRDYDGDGEDPGSYECDGSDYLDDVALWAHTTDLRADLEGTQSVELLTVFAFGQGSELLKKAAKNGGFRDRNGNGRPDLQEEWDEDGDGTPDAYFEAPSGNELEESLIAAITEILRRAASGTAVSILATSGEGEGALYQAYFLPSVFEGLREVRWIGYLQALWVDHLGNLREDTDGDGRLVYSRDEIVRFVTDPDTGETRVERYADADGDGWADSTEPDETVGLADLRPIWEAGKRLALRDADDRTVLTFADRDGDGHPDTGEVVSFSVDNASVLRPFLGAADLAEAQRIIRFIRGEQVTGMRDRTLTVDGSPCVWKLGDIVHSTPTVVSRPMDDYQLIYQDQSYGAYYRRWRDREVVVYVGANDGMLHAFAGGQFHPGDDPSTDQVEHGWYSGSLGEELWAFVPCNLLPHLRWLTDPDYTHVYYVDLKPKALDARIFTPDDDHPNGWGTVLICGMRLGGGPIALTDDFDGDGSPETRTFRSAWFALDVTVPTDPRLLWEFTDANLGFTTSYPAVVRVASGSTERWLVVFGSGPTDLQGGSDQPARVYVLDLATGQLLRTLQADDDAFFGPPTAVDVGLDYQVDVIYLGESCWQGSSWRGKVYRVETAESVDPSTWTLSSLTGQLNGQPITAPLAVSTDWEGNLWVYFGTGRYLAEEDKTDATLQTFYGIRDPKYDVETDNDELVVSRSDLLDVSEAKVYESGWVDLDGDGNLDLTFQALRAEVREDYQGWRRDLLQARERVLDKPSVLGGVVLFTSFSPNADICGFGGEGYLYGLYFETGTAYEESVMGIEEELVGGEARRRVVEQVELGVGLPSSLSIHVSRRLESQTAFIQQSTGAIRQVQTTVPLRAKSGIRSWREVR